MALAAVLTVGQSTLFATITSDITIFLEEIGFCLLALLLATSFSSGIASCRKDGKLAPVVSTSIAWAIVTTVLLSLCGALCFELFKAKFPVTSTSGMDTSVLDLYPAASLADLGFLTFSPLGFFEAIRNLLPAFLIVAFVIGYYLKPNVEVIRPAYVVMNSFSETMFRIARAATLSSYIFVFFASCAFFSDLWNEGSIFVAGDFLLMMVTAAVAAGLVVLPLLFAIATKFKANPYQQLYRSIAPMVVGLFSGDILLTSVIEMPTSRHNLGCQKRISSTSVPFYAMFGRGGSAMIGTISLLALIQAIKPEAATSTVAVTIALACALASFASPLSFGSEVFLIVTLALRLLGINLYGSQIAIIALLPLLNGLGVMVDTLVASYGASHTAQVLDVRINTPYKDTL